MARSTFIGLIQTFLNWDLNQIKVLHRALNETMKREVAQLLTLGDAHAAMREEVL